jgi:hypothetical protein
MKNGEKELLVRVVLKLQNFSFGTTSAYRIVIADGTSRKQKNEQYKQKPVLQAADSFVTGATF